MLYYVILCHSFSVLTQPDLCTLTLELAFKFATGFDNYCKCYVL